tara:strand:- start:1090 stop:1674 length:585 start_codon:yes stop_codon:yes gene_type:complete
MVKLVGKNKILSAVFISGRGSNLKSIYNYSIKKNSKICVELVISSKSDVLGVKFARKYNIKTKIINYKNKVKAEARIIKLLKKNNIQLICLAGFMKVLSKNFVKSFKNKIINIHPSLLPKYKGLNTHERAIKNRDRFSGCTVHYVNQNLDSGKIILKQKVKLYKSDTPEQLAKRILKVENKLYPRAINKVISNF